MSYGITVDVYAAIYYPSSTTTASIVSSYPWDEETLQLLKTIHIEKINAHYVRPNSYPFYFHKVQKIIFCSDLAPRISSSMNHKACPDMIYPGSCHHQCSIEKAVKRKEDI